MIKSTLLKAFLLTIVITAVSMSVTWLVGLALGNPVNITAMVLSAVLPIVTAFPSLCILLTKYSQLNEQHRLLEIAHADLIARAKIDHMTGLLNRESLFEAVKISRARIDTGAFLMIDADHFKAINDNFGHATGDRALKLIAFAIENVTRKGDLVGRIGGEEFCVFLPNASGDTAKRVAERIRSEVDATHFYSDDDVLYPLTVSIGCTTAPKNESNSQILSRADQALYTAKQRGRNCYVFISENSVEENKIVNRNHHQTA